MSETILLVDDDPRVLKTFVRNLRVLGYTVFSASDGREALDLYARERPAVVLLDMRMPDLDGLAVLRLLRALDPEADVVLTTGHGEKDAVIEALRAGASDFVPKPIDQVALEALLRRARERQTMRQRLRSTQQALQESEARYRVVSELISDYAYAFRVEPDGSLAREWVTEAFWSITGFETDDFDARGGWRALLLPEDLPVAQARSKRLLSGEVDVSEFRIVTQTGAVRWLRDYGRPVWDALEGRVVRIYGAAQDITAYKEAEAALQAYKERLEALVAERTEALRQSEEMARSVVAQSYDGIVLTDAQGRIVVWNAGLERIFGTPRADALGRLLWEVQFGLALEENRTPERRAQLEMMLRDLFENRGAPWLNQLHETQIQRPDGTRRFIQSLTFSLETDSGFMVGSIIRDITEQVRANQALRESEQRYRTLVELSPNLIAIHQGGRVTFVNAAGLGLLGATDPEAVVGQPISDFIVEEELPQAQERVQELLARGLRSPLYEQTLLRLDGTTWIAEVVGIPFEQEGRPAVQLIARDITARKRLERAQQDEAAFLETLLDTIPNPIFSKDVQGRYQHCNAAFAEQILGIPPEHIVGRTLYDFAERIPKDLADRYQEQDQRLFDAPGTQIYEAEVLCADGVRRSFTFYKATYIDAQGQVAGLVGVMLDITTHKSMERALRQCQQRLAALEDA